jgi:diaminopimelate decarboxylase
MDSLRFLTPDTIHDIRTRFATPVFVYSEQILREQARKVVWFPHHFGLTARYAMKTSSNKNILRILSSEWLHIDASSGYEVSRALSAGIPPAHIQLTGQEMPENLREIVEMGVEFNATSLHQLETYGQLFPGTHASIRVNPGMGSGGTKRTNVWGPASSFGIWHEYLEQALSIAAQYDLTITKLHTHIGSGSDPEAWKKVAGMVLAIVERLPDVTIVSLGGGFKVARMDYEKTADLLDIGEHVKGLFWDFALKTGRQLHLEVEPGTFIAANSGSLITEVIDVIDTGAEGYNFIKVNAGMTEVTRPSLYGSQHPIVVVPKTPNEESKEYIVVGHNCESGDIFTPAPSDPEWLLTRELADTQIWDTLVIEGVGSYCASMSTHGYNSFPEAGELLLRADGTISEIRKRAEPRELWRNELTVI